MAKQKVTNLLIYIVSAELIGALSGIAAGGGFGTFYRSILQPPFAPPGWVFPVAWVILYALMGISAYLIDTSGYVGTQTAMKLYCIQLFVNFLWSPVFFRFRSFAGATVVILVLLVLVLAMLNSFRRISKTAALLNIPYLLWLIYASYLTIGILILN